MINLLFIIAVILASVPVFAGSRDPVPTDEKNLHELLRIAQEQKDLPSALDAVGQWLLGTPYKLGVSGEGLEGDYDRDPLWRLDALDCTTYVETVMAVSLAHDISSFLQRLFRIRYENGRISYVTRNHFPEVDWIPINERAGFVHDLTRELFPDRVRTTSVVISKSKWYAAKTANDIEPKERDESEREKLAGELRALAAGFKDERASIDYLPMSSFFIKNSQSGELRPNHRVLRRIPNATIFNIVREGWAPGGQSMAISHQGFVVQKLDGTYMRHAALHKQVLEERLDLYFKRFLNSPTVRGINLLQVKNPLEKQ